jgi:hypothetical protein
MYPKTIVSKILLLVAVIFAGTIVLAPTVMAGQKSRSKRMYRVTITNITLGQPVAPSVIATHTKKFRLFELGGPTPVMGDPGYDVYFGLATAAETGFPGTLLDAVSASKGVDEAVVLATDASPPILLPGESNSTTISASRSAQFLSIAAMLGQTNDGFYALRSVRLPFFIGESKYYYADGYDAGSEDNDETGIGGMDGDVGDTGVGINDGSGEGFIHVHVGIHGIGILDPEIYDWRNPVVEVKIQRIK